MKCRAVLRERRATLRQAHKRDKITGRLPACLRMLGVKLEKLK